MGAKGSSVRPPMRIIGIETSCDETAVAVVEDGQRVRSNVIASQVEMHARYGGVVPEVASRQHLLQIVPAMERSLADAGVGLEEIDAIAVTHGPGLVGALMVGVNTAKALAYTRDLPAPGRAAPGGPRLRRVAGVRGPGHGAGLSVGLPHRLGRSHRPGADARPRGLRGAGPDPGRRGGGGLRQGGPRPGAGVPRGTGDPAGGGRSPPPLWPFPGRGWARAWTSASVD